MGIFPTWLAFGDFQSNVNPTTYLSRMSMPFQVLGSRQDSQTVPENKECLSTDTGRNSEQDINQSVDFGNSVPDRTWESISAENNCQE